MSSFRATSLGVMRPPKPPCWRDFVLSTPKSTNSDGVDNTEQSGRTIGVRSPVPDVVETSKVAASLPGNKPSRLVRRPRAKLHRTRSEHIIHAEDLPESAFTATLANTDPKGVRVRTADGRLYVEENNRRCQNWLANIEAAEPLDKVDYTTEHKTTSSNADRVPDVIQDSQIRMVTDDTGTDHSGRTDNYPIPLYELQHGVDVEIPEETFYWSSSMNPRHQSPSSGEAFCSPCRDAPRPEGSHIFSGNPQTPQSASPPLSSRGLVDSAQKNKYCAEYPKCESSSGNCSAKASKCGKILRGKKLYKLCCDHEDAGSSSCRENDYPGYPVDSEEESKIQMTGEHIQKCGFSQVDSRTPSSSRRIRSVSRPSAVDKFLTHSELSALKQSTLDLP